MKKILLTILAIVYFGISTGITLHVHYCMGTLVNIGLVNKTDNRCSKCGMMKQNSHKGCCHDEQKSVKIVQDQNTATEVAYQMTQLASVAVIPDHINLPVALISLNIPRNLSADFPPQTHGAAIYIRNCVFRI